MDSTRRVVIDTTGSGAIATGTVRSDAPIMSVNGWRWSRRLEAWYLPRTFRPETVDRYVERTAEALAAAGLEVERVDGPRDDEDTRTTRRQERDHELVDLNERRAAKAQAEADASFAKADQILDMIPPGQPILVGHHSEGRHLRDLATVDRAMRWSIEAADAARTYRNRAAAAAQRVELAATERTTVDPATIQPGDLVRAETPKERYDRGWHRVIRVNRKTVTVPSIVGGAWTDTIPLDHLVELRRPDPEPGATT